MMLLNVARPCNSAISSVCLTRNENLPFENAHLLSAGARKVWFQNKGLELKSMILFILWPMKFYYDCYHVFEGREYSAAYQAGAKYLPVRSKISDRSPL